MKQESRVRNAEDVIWGELFPSPGVAEDRRHLAICEVLCRIPDTDYQKLIELVDDFVWFVPDMKSLAEVFPIPQTSPGEEPEEGKLRMGPYSKVLYLSPLLEHRAWDILIACVAHELAHIFLQHTITGIDREGYKAGEESAWRQVCVWGFEKEEKKHHTMSKWQDSWEECMIRRLKEKLER